MASKSRRRRRKQNRTTALAVRAPQVRYLPAPVAPRVQVVSITRRAGGALARSSKSALSLNRLSRTGGLAIGGAIGRALFLVLKGLGFGSILASAIVGLLGHLVGGTSGRMVQSIGDGAVASVAGDALSVLFTKLGSMFQAQTSAAG